MNSFFTIGFGAAGPGLLPQQAVWLADADFDALAAGELDEYPGIVLYRTVGEGVLKGWYLVIKDTLTYFDFRGTGLDTTFTCLTQPTGEQIAELKAAYESYVPEDSQLTRGWHIVHENF